MGTGQVIDNSKVYVEHYVVLLGKVRDLTTVSKVVGIGHECVYVKNSSHTGTKVVKQEHLIRLVK